MNLLIGLFYRDGGNWKRGMQLVLEGELGREQMEAVSNACDDNLFIPEAVGLPHPMDDTAGFPDEDDHPWVGLCTLEVTDLPVSLKEVNAREFHQNMLNWKGRWMEYRWPRKTGLPYNRW